MTDFFESSYMYMEQSYEVLARFDAFGMLKITYDEEIRIDQEQIDFGIRYEGEQTEIFETCLGRIFGEFDKSAIGFSAFSGEVEHLYVIPYSNLTKLKLFYRSHEYQEYTHFVMKTYACYEEFPNAGYKITIKNEHIQLRFCRDSHFGGFFAALRRLVELKKDIDLKIKERFEVLRRNIQEIEIEKSRCCAIEQGTSFPIQCEVENKMPKAQVTHDSTQGVV